MENGLKSSKFGLAPAAALALLAAAASMPAAAYGGNLFFTDNNTDTIRQCGTAGNLVNSALVDPCGLNDPVGMDVAGSNRLAAGLYSTTIGEHNALTGAPRQNIDLSADLTGTVGGIAVSASDLLVTDWDTAYDVPDSAIDEYDLDTRMLSTMVRGLDYAKDLAAAGSDRYVPSCRTDRNGNPADSMIGDYNLATGTWRGTLLDGDAAIAPGITASDGDAGYAGGLGDVGGGGGGGIAGRLSPAPAVIWAVPSLLGVVGLVRCMRKRKWQD